MAIPLFWPYLVLSLYYVAFEYTVSSSEAHANKTTDSRCKDRRHDKDSGNAIKSTWR
jgi:hypothetical protein